MEWWGWLIAYSVTAVCITILLAVGMMARAMRRVAEEDNRPLGIDRTSLGGKIHRRPER